MLLVRGGRTIKATKVQGHAIDETVAAGELWAEDQVGNIAADEAELGQLSDGIASLMPSCCDGSTGTNPPDCDIASLHDCSVSNCLEHDEDTGTALDP